MSAHNHILLTDHGALRDGALTVTESFHRTLLRPARPASANGDEPVTTDRQDGTTADRHDGLGDADSTGADNTGADNTGAVITGAVITGGAVSNGWSIGNGRPVLVAISTAP